MIRTMRVLVIWDFDWSLVEENSDVYIVQQLAPDLMPQFGQLRVEGLGWTQIMAHMMEGLWDKGIREQDIVACLAQLSLQPRMIDTVNLINSSGAMQVLRYLFVYCITLLRNKLELGCSSII
jgi:pyridoxal phosphate phosphatase PHOSPHO2